jgi:hypothetical protein
MNPLVEAAWIAGSGGFVGVLVGVSGTVIVGIAGYRNARAAADRTALAAHNERVWDRKADAYQDALAAALWRYHRRTYLSTAKITQQQYDSEANELFHKQSEQEWWALQGRLGTFGAPEVVEAYNRSLTASEVAHKQHEEWRNIRRQIEDITSGDMVPDLTAVMQKAEPFFTELKHAMGEAQRCDYLLEQAIRKDLDASYAASVRPVQIFTNLNSRALQPQESGSLAASSDASALMRPDASAAGR